MKRKKLSQKEIQIGKYKVIICEECPEDKNTFIYNNDGEGGQFWVRSVEKKLDELFRDEL